MRIKEVQPEYQKIHHTTRYASSTFDHSSEAAWIARYSTIAHIPPDVYLGHAELCELAEKQSRERQGWVASRYAVKRAAWKLCTTQGTPQVHSACRQNEELYPTDTFFSFARALIVSHASLGMPRLYVSGEGVCSMSVSLSHADEWGAAIVSVFPVVVGIDIERIRDWREKTLRAFLTEKEYVEVSARPSVRARNELATRYWSAKEAHLKALGVGLRRHPRTVSISSVDIRYHGEIDNHVMSAVRFLYGR